MVSDKTISAVATHLTMLFRLFLLYSLVLLGRPQDILPFLQPFRPALVLTALAIVGLVFGGRRQELSIALSTPEAKRYLLFVLIVIVGVPFAYHRRVAFEAVLFYGVVQNLIFFVLLITQVTSLQRLKSLLWVICVCTVMYSVFGGLLQADSVSGGRFNLVGRMFDANDTAYVLVSFFPLCLYFVRFNEGLLKRVVAVTAILASIAVILQTGSRGGILGFGAVLLILFLTKAGGIGKIYKLFSAVVLVSILLYVGDSIDVERYMTLTDIASDYNVDDPGGRMELWKGAVALSLANPITGVGLECFGYAHFLLKAAAGETYLRYHSIHNSYLQIASEIGLIGFAVFVSIVVRSFATFFRISRIQMQPETRETSELIAIGGFVLLGYTGLLVSGFFLTQGHSAFITLFFGLAAAMVRLQVSSSVCHSSSQEASFSSTRVGRNARFTQVAVRDSETRKQIGGKGTGGQARHGWNRESGR